MATAFSAMAAVLREHPDLAVFLVVGLGSLLGSYKFRNLSLGIVTGSLFMGLLVGQLGIPVSAPAKQIVFSLFLLATGYTIGPQFLSALRGDGIKLLLLAVTQCFIGLIVALIVARVLDLDLGLSAGLMSGGLTQSAIIGTAGSAIMSLPLPLEQRELLVSHIAIADSLTYVFGTLGTIWFLSLLGPKLLRIDLRQSSLELEKEYGLADSQPGGALPGVQAFAHRTVLVVNPALAGARVIKVEKMLLPRFRLYVGRIRRDGQIHEASPGSILRLGDRIALSGRQEAVIEAISRIGEEVSDDEMLNVSVARVLVLVGASRSVGRSLRNLSMLGKGRGVFIRSLRRLGQEMPLLPETSLQRGDVVELIGRQDAVNGAAEHLGQAYTEGQHTDLRAVCLALFFGGLVGIPSMLVGSLSIGLGTSVGILLGGIALGWLHSVRPTFGSVPEAASFFMSSFGLAAFVGMTGMQAGPHFTAALREYGLGLLFGGMVVTLLPLLFGVLFGRYALRINPVLVLGACAGARVSTPALAAVQEQAQSSIAVLGYTAPYAVGQILLTFWGSLIISILA